MEVLPNPVDGAKIRAAAAGEAGSDEIRLLAAGRLSREKGFDLLVEAFAGIAGRWPGARLRILGEGPERGALERQIGGLGLGVRVSLSGALDELWPEFAGVRAFVLASRADALPNALLEAAAAGLPIVATPASEGLSRLVAGRDGVWMAAEVSAMALEAALEECLGATETGSRFPHEFVEPFLLPSAGPAWTNLLKSPIAGEAR